LLFLIPTEILGRYGKSFGGLRPVVFAPGTLWRTWGTRPVPNGVLLGD
jgi:hypothetical protein